MHKRGQIYVFLLIGVVVVLSMAMFFALRSRTIENVLVPEQKDAYDLLSEKAALEGYVDSCLEKTVKNGYQQVGLDEYVLGLYIDSNLDDCVDLSVFEKQGIRVGSQDIKATVKVNDHTIVADVDFEITLVKEESLVEVDRFGYSVERAVSYIIETDSEGCTSEDLRFTSGDNLVTLMIPGDTCIANDDGTPYVNPEIGIILDALEEMDNTIHGYRIYHLEPSGITFEPPIVFRIKYDDDGMGSAEVSLAVVKRRDALHIWKTVPTEVNVNDNEATAIIDSFSEYGISIKCGNEGANDHIHFDTEFMYLAGCEPCLCFEQSEETGAWFAPSSPSSDNLCDTEEEKVNRCGVNKDIKAELHEITGEYYVPRGGTEGYMSYSQLEITPDKKTSIKEECIRGCIIKCKKDCAGDTNCISNCVPSSTCKTKCESLINNWDEKKGCESYDWNGDGEPEWGYPSEAAAGGSGKFSFNLESSGNCIDEIKVGVNNILVDDKITEFTLINGADTEVNILDEMGFTSEEIEQGIDPNIFKEKINEAEDLFKEKFESGENTFRISIKNEHMVCSYARMLFRYTGTQLNCNPTEDVDAHPGKCCHVDKGETISEGCDFPTSLPAEISPIVGLEIADPEADNKICEITVAECTKLGFMVFKNEDLDEVLEFTGPGGWVMRTFGAKGYVWGKGTDIGAAKSFVSEARNAELNPIVRVIVNRREDKTGMESGDSDNADDYVSFITELVKGAGDSPIFVQIGNEPNNNVGPGSLSGKQYAEMITKVDEGLEAGVRAKVYIVTAGLSPTPQGGGQGNVDFAREFLGVTNIEDAFDVWGSHSYPSWSDAGGLANAELFESELNGVDKPVLITEAGPGDGKDINTDGAIAAINAWNQDQKVLGVTFFVLYQQDWVPQTWLEDWNGEGKEAYKALKIDGDRYSEITYGVSCNKDFTT